MYSLFSIVGINAFINWLIQNTLKIADASFKKVFMKITVFRFKLRINGPKALNKEYTIVGWNEDLAFDVSS